jgi:acetolactate synthase I/II/III large subunit
MSQIQSVQKYSDQIMLWLSELNYTQCFFLGGGNCMHLVDSANKFFNTTPVIHEVSAGIAAEYFTDLSDNAQRAFSVVTAGPGVTNIVSAVSAAWLESRPLLIIAGQAKTSNLSTNGARQIGHQEIDAVSIMKSMTKAAIQISSPISKNQFQSIVLKQFEGRPGPVFIEFCLDITSMPVLKNESSNESNIENSIKEKIIESEVETIVDLISRSKKPLFLFGGGLSRDSAKKHAKKLEELGIPIAVTWNGADRISADYKYYCGRPNTYGMRFSNVIIQESDLLITFGTRLGIQQIGFAWEEFASKATIVQIEIDESELTKGFPKVDYAIQHDANNFLDVLCQKLNSEFINNLNSWHEYILKIKEILPTVEKNYVPIDQYVEPYELISELNTLSNPNDVWVSCSSGGTFTAFMQVVQAKKGQKIISSKGLASMGFGLAGAIGASLSNPNSRIILTEGDGGFAQNMQELGTVAINKLNIKIFLMSNDGYASIRTSQKSYFGGNYLGCDSKTGLMLPEWESIAKSYGLDFINVNSKNLWNERMLDLFNSPLPTLFIINIDPEQPYLPKVTSRILEDGSMVSNPINKMYPPLDSEVEKLLGFKID